jgi:hypothetical protein
LVSEEEVAQLLEAELVKVMWEMIEAIQLIAEEEADDEEKRTRRKREEVAAAAADRESALAAADEAVLASSRAAKARVGLATATKLSRIPEEDDQELLQKHENQVGGSNA